jgi:uncharacterized protein
MRVVLDTNVLVSAILKDRSPEDVVSYLLLTPDVAWIASPALLAEYKSVLSRPRLGLSSKTLSKWLVLFETSVSIVEPRIVIPFPRDQSDAKFLECALAANAQFLITGDRDFSEARRILETTIISVSQFKRIFCP